MLPHNSASEIFSDAPYSFYPYFVSVHIRLSRTWVACLWCGSGSAEVKSLTSMNKINMVHLRKISLAELWGSIKFFISKIFFVFHFDHF